MTSWKLALCSAQRVPSISVSMAASSWIAGRRLAPVADIAARAVRGGHCGPRRCDRLEHHADLVDVQPRCAGTLYQ
jgi:hypothetical protein